MFREYRPYVLLMVAILTIAVLGLAVQPALAAPSRDGDYPDRETCCKSPDECFPPYIDKNMLAPQILTGLDKHCYLNDDYEKSSYQYCYPAQYGYYPCVYGCQGYNYPPPPKRVYYTHDCDCYGWYAHKKSSHGYYPYKCDCHYGDQHKKSSHTYQAHKDGCWVDGRFTTYCHHQSYSTTKTNYWYMRNGVWVQNR